MIRLEKLLGFILWKDFWKSSNFGTFKSPLHFWPFANETLNHNFNKVIIKHMKVEEGILKINWQQ